MVPRQKHNQFRAQIVAKGYTNPLHTMTYSLQVHHCLHTESASHKGIGVQLVSLHRRCQCCISTRSSNYNLAILQKARRHIMQRLNKALYSCTSPRKQWQDVPIAHIRKQNCLVYIITLCRRSPTHRSTEHQNTARSSVETHGQPHRKNNTSPEQEHNTQRQLRGHQHGRCRNCYMQPSRSVTYERRSRRRSTA